MAATRWIVLFLASALGAVASGSGAVAKSSASRNPTAPAARTNASGDDDAQIPLPKDLMDNSDPFNAGPSSETDAGSRYFRQQQNFREQDPIRDQEGDRIIRQFE